MDKVILIAIITALYGMEIGNPRSEYVKNAAKENNIKEGELFKLLKEAGYDPKAPKGTAVPEIKDNPADEESLEPKKSVSLRHKTEYSHYRRAGLVLTNQFKPYEVTEKQLEILEKDPWVEIGK